MNPEDAKNISAYYDEYWSSDFRRREDVMRDWWAPAFHHLHEIMGDLSGRAVVEIGAGDGAHAAYLASRGATVYAVDFSEKSVRAAAGTPNVVPVRADSHHLPFADNSVDAAMVANMIMFTQKEQVLAECRRIVAPGGFVYLIEPLRYPHIIMLARLFESHSSQMKYRFLSLGELARLAKMFGEFRHREFLLTSAFAVLAARVFPNSAFLRKTMAALSKIDSPILRCAPFLRNLCYLTVARLRVD